MSGKFLMRLWKDESGISSVEYALLLAFVASAIIFAAIALSEAVSLQMTEAANCLNATAGSVNTAC